MVSRLPLSAPDLPDFPGDMAKYGYDVTVFEALHEIGGVLKYGIPEFRLPNKVVDVEIENLAKMGVNFIKDCIIGKTISVEQLEEEGFKGVFVASGAGLPNFMNIPGENSINILSSNEYLTRVNLMDAASEDSDTPVPFGKNVAVIGGGNVSMDAVRTAKRLGAKKVSIVYRRRVADMTALPAEIEAAVAEGVELLTLVAPAGIEVDENGHVSGVRVTPQMISTIKDGRASVTASGEPDYVIPCQTMIVAIGQNIETKHYEESGIPVSRGKIVTLPNGGFADIPGVFAGGDCASGPATVIKAVAAAKVTAANIDEYLGFHHQITSDVEIPYAGYEDKEPCGRVEVALRDAADRKKDFEPIEYGFSCEEACQESGRCLRCDHFGFGSFRGGREEKW